MTFARYLKEQVDRNDAVGDFARDILLAENRPRGKAGYMAWHSFLVDWHYAYLAKRAFISAWDEYKSQHSDNKEK